MEKEFNNIFNRDSAIINSINQKGYAKLDNFFDEKDVSLINLKLDNILKKKYTKGSYYYPTSIMSLLTTFAKFNVKKFVQGIFLMNLAKKYKLKKISDEYFGKKTELLTIDSYFSPRSNEMIVDWHSDVPVDIQEYPDKYTNWDRSLKFFIYVSDVDTNNGCLAFLPNSNLICKKVVDLILKKKVKVGRITELSKLRYEIINNQNLKNLLEGDPKLGKEIIQKFLNDTQFITKGDTSQFDLPMKRGGVIIFDEFGFHRGGPPTKTDRVVLRFFFKVKK